MSHTKEELAQQLQELNEKLNVLRSKGTRSKSDIKEKNRLSKLMTEIIVQLDGFDDDKIQDSNSE